MEKTSWNVHGHEHKRPKNMPGRADVPVELSVSLCYAFARFERAHECREATTPRVRDERRGLTEVLALCWIARVAAEDERHLTVLSLTQRGHDVSGHNRRGWLITLAGREAYEIEQQHVVILVRNKGLSQLEKDNMC